MTYAQQRYFCATAVAVMVAVVLRMANLPAPWPAAIAIYTYGLVAWPQIREEMLPNVKPAVYAMIWAGASMLVFVYEGLGKYAGY